MLPLEYLFSPGTMERLGWMLVHVLWQATVVAVLLAVFLRLLRRTGASVRYVSACAALALMIVLPIVTLRLIQVPGPVAEAGPPPATVVLPPADAPTAGSGRAGTVEYWNDGIMGKRPVDSPTFQYSSIPSFHSFPVPLRERIVSALEPALPYVVLGWLAGVFGLSAWHLGGWTQLQRLKRRMVRDIRDPLQRRLEELTLRLGVHRAVGLLESALVEVPTVVGWLRPVILLPASALTGLHPEQLEAILAHELAHIRRFDYLVNMLQTVVEILGFYHPAIWWVSHRIRIERENCCDDLAVQVCGSSLQYARALACMEEVRHHAGDLAVAATGGSLMARIARLLGRPAVEDRRSAWLPGLIALLLVVGVILPAALVFGTPRAPQTLEPAAVPVTSADQGATEPNAAPGEAESGSAPANGEAAQVLLDFRIVKVLDDLRPDRETLLLMANALGTESRLARELNRPGRTLDLTLDEILKRYVVPQSLSAEAAEAMIDLLQSRGYLEVSAKPRILTRDSVRAEVRIVGERFLPPSDPSAKPVRIEYGTVVNTTARVLDAHRVNLEMMAEVSDLVPGLDPNRPAVSRTSVETSVTAQNDRYLVWAAVKSTAPPAGQETSPGSVYVMVKPHINLPSRGLDSAAGTQIPAAPLRQLLLDVRTVTMQRGALQNLGVQWNWPTTKAGAFPGPGGGGVLTGKSGPVTVGYLPDQTFTDSLLTALDQLQKNQQVTISSQQLLVQEDRWSRLKTILEEWFSGAIRAGPASPPYPDLYKIDAGTVLELKPYLTDSNDILVLMSLEVSERAKAPDSRLPIVTRRTTKNSVTIRNGGTVAVAGMGGNPTGPNNESAHEMALFVTAHLVRGGNETPVQTPPAAAPDASVAPTLPLAPEQIALMRQNSVDSEPTMQKPRREQEPPFPLDPANLPVYEQLDREVDLSQLTPTMPLSTAIDVLRKSVEPPLNIVVLWRDLRDTLNIEPIKPIGMDGLPKVKLGKALETLVKVISDPADTTNQVDFIVDKGVIILCTPAGLPQHLKERAGSNTERRRGATITDTFINVDLLSILTEISQHSGVKITPDATVKATPVTAELAEASPETALQQVLKNTPYTFRRANDGTYLVFRPLSYSSQGDAQLMAALEDLSGAAGVTVIPDPNITGRVNASFKDVSLDEALPILLAGKPYVLKKVPEKNPRYYLVADRGLYRPSVDTIETRRVRLNQMSATRAKSLLSPVFAPYVQVESAERLDPNDQSRVLIITASPAMVDRIIADIRQIDRPPRQMLLDARVVVMERGDLLNLGVEWSWPKIQAGVFTSTVADPGAGVVSSGWPYGVQIGYTPDRTFTDSLMMALNLLKENSQADIIANPKVVAQDGRQAEMRVIQEEWFMMQANQSNLYYSQAQLQKIESGTVLTITPYIGDNNDITLQMAVEVSDSIPKARGSDLPLVTRRLAKNSVTIKDGGTVAVGGLTENRGKSSEKRVPYPGDIPLLGKLFQNKSNDKASREVAVFVTAHRVSDTGAVTPQAPESGETVVRVPPSARESGLGREGPDRAESPMPAQNQEQGKPAVQVGARFVAADERLLRDLRGRGAIRGVTSPQETEALHEMGRSLSEGRTLALTDEQTSLLMKAVQQYPDCSMLATPKVMVREDEPASL